MLKLSLKTLIVIFTVSLMSLVTTSCGSTTNATTAVEASVEPATDSEDELSSWDRYYLLSEKEQIEESKDSDYSELDYGTWDEYQVLKFMTFICEDESSSWMPYGSMRQFIDTSKLTKYKSALIAYYCIPGAGSTGVITIAVRLNDKNEIYTTNVLTEVHDYFGFENLELKGNQVNFAFSGYSKTGLGLCCRDIQDTGKIYYKDGFPLMEFTSFNDYRLNIYNLNFGPVFERASFDLLTSCESDVCGQDSIYDQAEKYKLKTGEVAVGKAAIVKKACEDFSYSIPKTDLASRGQFVSIPEVRKMITNWEEAARLEKELSLPLEYMRTFLDIASTEVISDDAWLEGLRQYNMIPKSEVEKLEAPLKSLGTKINNQSNKVCANYDLDFVAPNETKR
ncbi:MAG: hypothetical protein NTU55_00350 [Actinobacteria bacterium]|nr:hypothetical protein [Actinomycetota bacterium]